MKKISLITFLLFFAGFANAQPLTGSFTDCNNQTEDIQATLGTGYSIIIAHKGVDCSICINQAPSLETWAAQNSSKVKVWCALTYKYDPNNFSNQCQATNSWVSTHNWSNIFTFPDSNRVFVMLGTPQYYVYSPRDSTIKYSGSNRTTAYSVALQESTVSIQDQELKEDLKWSLQEGRLSIDNQSGKVIQLRILDLKGSLLNEFQVNSGTNSLNLGDLKQSIYLLQFQSEKGVYAEKVLLR